MTGRFALSLIALAAGVALASFVPGLSQSLRSVVGLAPGPGGAQPREAAASDTETRLLRAKPADDEPGILRLTQEQITAAGVELTTVHGGTLARHITVPGTVVPHADLIARDICKTVGHRGRAPKEDWRSGGQGRDPGYPRKPR